MSALLGGVLARGAALVLAADRVGPIAPTPIESARGATWRDARVGIRITMTALRAMIVIIVILTVVSLALPTSELVGFVAARPWSVVAIRRRDRRVIPRRPRAHAAPARCRGRRRPGSDGACGPRGGARPRRPARVLRRRRQARPRTAGDDMALLHEEYT
ncbi:MAG: hypothetical protein U1F43_11875 [Myxococcota bacterium]